MSRHSTSTRLASKLCLLLAAAILFLTALSDTADARYRKRYVVRASPVYATDFWGHCFVNRYYVWWLQMCPAQRMAYTQRYTRW